MRRRSGKLKLENDIYNIVKLQTKPFKSSLILQLILKANDGKYLSRLNTMVIGSYLTRVKNAKRLYKTSEWECIPNM